ncbi:MAG: GNAT family N-acetyltransferase [Alphaproteobacteria bacterium]|nr:MAG: GNAT family N-acetyltransferase [Alphaproteobacteria bacterium]
MSPGSFCPRSCAAHGSAAEEEGRRRGCTRIALTTLSVEAPGFYQKQGYDVAATIDCDPPGLTRYYMTKKL